MVLFCVGSPFMPTSFGTGQNVHVVDVTGIQTKKVVVKTHVTAVQSQLLTSHTYSDKTTRRKRMTVDPSPKALE